MSARCLQYRTTEVAVSAAEVPPEVDLRNGIMLLVLEGG
jgi:hypothetical protein